MSPHQSSLTYCRGAEGVGAVSGAARGGCERVAAARRGGPSGPSTTHIHLPARERGGVLIVVAARARRAARRWPAAAGARGVAGGGVEPEAEVPLVQPADQRRQPGREALRVPRELPLRRALEGDPAVVQVHVRVAERLHAVVLHGGGDALHLGLVAEVVRAALVLARHPAIPTERRRARQPIVDRSSQVYERRDEKQHRIPHHSCRTTFEPPAGQFTVWSR